MSWLDLPRTDEAEEIDDPGQPFAEIAVSMGDVVRTNRLFGGTAAVLHYAARLLRHVPRGTSVRILDIATGSADIPAALQHWGQKCGLDLHIVGVDNLPAMLRLARAQTPDVALVQADARRLPFAPRSFDLALCALAFHHFGFETSVQVLRAMDALTTRGFVVSDLRRDRLTLLAVKAGMALIRAHPFTRHDGPTSVRRSYTLREYQKMVALSGANSVRLHSIAHLRIALIQEKGESGPDWVRQT